MVLAKVTKITFFASKNYHLKVIILQPLKALHIA